MNQSEDKYNKAEASKSLQLYQRFALNEKQILIVESYTKETFVVLPVEEAVLIRLYSALVLHRVTLIALRATMALVWRMSCVITCHVFDSEGRLRKTDR